MSNEKAIFSMILVCFLLVFSYSYLIDEVQAGADADPTHSGKAWMADIFPYLYLVILFGAVGVTGVVVFEQVKY